MRPSAFTRLHIGNQEEKEQRLRDFIVRHVNSLKETGQSMAGTRFRLLALSLESPVAQALGGLAREIAELGIVIEAVVLTKTSAASAETAIPGVVCRIATDRRLFDAHEQLLLGPATVWTGDCMRREPTKRDAYQCFTQNCEKTARWAESSFARIWALAKPAGRDGAPRKTVPNVEHALLDASLIANPEMAPDPVALRH